MLLTFWMWYYWRTWGDSHLDSKELLNKNKCAIGAMICFNWCKISSNVYSSDEIDIYQKITFPLVSLFSILTIPIDFFILPIEFLYASINY